MAIGIINFQPRWGCKIDNQICQFAYLPFGRLGVFKHLISFAFRLLPSAFRLIPSAFCLIPLAFDLSQ